MVVFVAVTVTVVVVGFGCGLWYFTFVVLCFRFGVWRCVFFVDRRVFPNFTSSIFTEFSLSLQFSGCVACSKMFQNRVPKPYEDIDAIDRVHGWRPMTLAQCCGPLSRVMFESARLRRISGCFIFWGRNMFINIPQYSIVDFLNLLASICIDGHLTTICFSI